MKTGIWNKSQILRGNDLPWQGMPDHVKLYHRCLLSPEMADALKVHVSTILWERIGVGGAVLPHYHDTAEVIHFIKGRVRVLFNGEWISCRAGDTLYVPKGTVHSVKNDDEVPTEQVSVFLPVGIPSFPNRPFQTVLVDGSGEESTP